MLCPTRCAQLDITHCQSRVFKSQGLKILVHKGLKIPYIWCHDGQILCQVKLPSTYMPTTWHSARQAQLFQTNKEKRLLYASKSVYTVAKANGSQAIFSILSYQCLIWWRHEI